MNLDWHLLKAVVLESDDWGLAAWSPDEQAHRVLTGTPAFRTAAGRLYGRSTLESAEDVRQLATVLLGVKGRDGLPPVFQANTIVANPDYDALEPPTFSVASLPVVMHPQMPSRWHRPGLWDAVHRAEDEGVWWAELHGLHHLPASVWLHALRRGMDDARRAHAQASPICQAVQDRGEYDAGESQEVRAADLAAAVEGFTRLFGRAPSSFCPPDYRFDDWLEREAEKLGLNTLQGKPEQARGRWVALRRRWLMRRFPHQQGGRFYMPPRIAFEPRGNARPDGRVGHEAALRGVRAAWRRGQPAILSTHRLNFASLDPSWSQAGRDALRALMLGLSEAGAVFLTDAEVRQACERAWSFRPVGSRGALLRQHGGAQVVLRFPVPQGVTGAHFRSPRGGTPPTSNRIKVEAGMAETRVDVGEYLLEWERA
ncbi:MAG: hypothetical protein ABIU54_12010 [Candidatus Eisenbacteria bacterium]